MLSGMYSVRHFGMVERVMKCRLLIILTASVSLVGCGQWGGGASVVPAVTVLPAGFGSAEPADVEPGESVDVASTPEAAGGFGSFEGQVVLTGNQIALAAADCRRCGCEGQGGLRGVRCSE